MDNSRYRIIQVSVGESRTGYMLQKKIWIPFPIWLTYERSDGWFDGDTWHLLQCGGTVYNNMLDVKEDLKTELRKYESTEIKTLKIIETYK